MAGAAQRTTEAVAKRVALGNRCSSWRRGLGYMIAYRGQEVY